MAMLTQTLSLDRGSSDSERCLRDPSFSSYLSGGNEECRVINFSKMSFDSGDEEIGVFSADKYFNERLEDAKKPEVGLKSVIMIPPVQDLLASVQPKAKSGASSVRSGSSWNSQSALLVHGNPLVDGTSRARGRSYLGSFRCRCVCADKNSVTVDEYQGSGEVATKETQKRGVSQVTEGSHCMPNQGGPEGETHPTSKELSVVDLLMKARKSLEIFGSPMLERRHKPFSFETERNLTTMSWEGELPRPAEAVVIPTMAIGADAGSDSDASSDLFEIEDFTGKVNYPFLSRNISGSGTPTAAAYAPSEASIEWSVVTASAADFPITSDYDEANKSCNKLTSTGMNQKITATSDKPRRRSSSFLGCNSQDSVKVVDRAHTTYEKRPVTKIIKSQDLPAQVCKAQSDAKLTGFETARNLRLGVSSRSLAKSISLHG